MEKYWQGDLRLIPLLGGTLPSDAFTDGLGLAAYWLPAANSNNRQHDTNEHFVLNTSSGSRSFTNGWFRRRFSSFKFLVGKLELVKSNT